jgi:ferric-dicitrate binding protein FerR (iron transport regulator)
MLAEMKQPLPAGQQAGVISAILHNAMLQPTSSADSKADYGTLVAWSDAVRTDGNGRVRVTLANAILSIGSNSEVVFNDRQGETTSLTLTYGQIRFRPTSTDKVEVRTPVAIVTGTGSDFAIDASVPNQLRVICLQGTVQVANTDSGGTSECDAGEMVVAKAGRAPYQAQVADATTLGIARNITDPEQQSPVQYFP